MGNHLSKVWGDRAWHDLPFHLSPPSRPCCLYRAPFAAGPFGTIHVGHWQGGGYTEDTTGAFSYCSVKASNLNGVILASQVVRYCEDAKSKPIIQLSSTVFLL
jgi:hypothetical protein